MLKEPCLGYFWFQNGHVSYFLFHCFFWRIVLMLELSDHCYTLQFFGKLASPILFFVVLIEATI